MMNDEIWGMVGVGEDSYVRAAQLRGWHVVKWYMSSCGRKWVCKIKKNQKGGVRELSWVGRETLGPGKAV